MLGCSPPNHLAKLTRTPSPRRLPNRWAAISPAHCRPMYGHIQHAHCQWRVIVMFMFKHAFISSAVNTTLIRLRAEICRVLNIARTYSSRKNGGTYVNVSLYFEFTAMLLGALIGAERQWRQRMAGLRTTRAGGDRRRLLFILSSMTTLRQPRRIRGADCPVLAFWGRASSCAK